jgi:sugar phosphate isomerase/epimerase
MPDGKVKTIKNTIEQSKLYVSVIGAYQINHTARDPEERAKNNRYFNNVIELAGQLGVRFVGTGSGKMPDKPLSDQVAEIVRVYNEQYFRACERNNIRILWEPWAGGPNVATGPEGYEALFNAFGTSPYVGIQYDPSHLVWQMMDPIVTARDFADKIYDIHLKDTEIRWSILRKIGIHPWSDDQWWRFRTGRRRSSCFVPAWPAHMSEPVLRLSDGTRARPRAQTSALSGLVSTDCAR